jgi:chemotaxis protein CheX
MRKKEVEVNANAMATGEAAVAAEIRENLLEPFIAATCTTLGEMNGIEVVVKSVSQSTADEPGEVVTAVLELVSEAIGRLVLRFPRQTAVAFARRFLAGVKDEIDEDLTRDCIGEIANVVAGQAKAMLAETAYRFAFSIPRVVVADCPELRTRVGQKCLVISFSSCLGGFTLQLFLK